MDLPAIVLDNGSETIKAGFSHGSERTKGEHIEGASSSSSSSSPLLSPQVSFPCLIGTPRLPAIPIENKRYFGDELTRKITLLRTKRPIVNGAITNFEDVEAIWEHIFQNVLHVDIAQHRALLTEIPFNPPSLREKTTEIFFEKFKVPGFYLEKAPLLSLFTAGLKSGLVIDSGHSQTSIVPIQDGSDPR